MAVIDYAMPKTDRWTAREQYKRYMKALADGKTDPRYRELMEAYKQMGMGRRVVSLFNAMQTAGADTRGRPKLAIARADQRWCWYEPRAFYDRDGQSQSRFIGDPSKQRPRDIYGIPCRWKTESSNAVAFPSVAMPWTANDRAVAAVPLIPPEVCPKEKHRYHILFEADWQAPPKDPLLLRRVGKDVWVILAEWNLTEIERAVLNASQML